MSRDITIRGGRRGLNVAVDDIQRAAHVLIRLAAELTHISLTVTLSSLRTGPPRRVYGRIFSVTSASGILGCADHLTRLSSELGCAATVYAMTERVNAAEIEAARRVLGGVHGVARAGPGFDENDYSGVAIAPIPQREQRPMATGVGLTRLLADQQLIDNGTVSPGQVRITQMVTTTGEHVWVVAIPGTQAWDPVAGINPADLTTDVAAMGGATVLAQRGIAQALAAVQADAGRAGRKDPVLLVGHSLGGILAARLAGDESFRREQNVRSVVAFGAPVGVLPVPDAVDVLAIAHRQDPVPRLDLSDDPEAENRISIDLDAPGAASRPPVMRPRAGLPLPVRLPQGGPWPTDALSVEAHQGSRYLASAERLDELIASQRRQGVPSSLTEWARANAAFLEQPTSRVVTDVRIDRVPSTRSAQ